jgi:hypothetical protein
MINTAAHAMRCNFHDRFHRLPPFDSHQDLRPMSRLRLGKEPMTACCKAASDENIFTDDGANGWRATRS